MLQRGWMVGLAALALVMLTTAGAQGENKKLKPSKEWSGSVADEALAEGAPTLITDAKAFGELWKSWKLGDKMPKVDFSKEFVVLTTTRGSKLNLSLSLDDEKGNLQVLGLATRDLRPGFRYVIASVSREGVRMVDGKKLPKAESK